MFCFHGCFAERVTLNSAINHRHGSEQIRIINTDQIVLTFHFDNHQVLFVLYGGFDIQHVWLSNYLNQISISQVINDLLCRHVFHG